MTTATTKRVSAGSGARLPLLTLTLVAALGVSTCPPTQATPQGSLPAALLTQVASFSGQAPKLQTAPLVQWDLSSKYYKSMTDGLTFNFKRAIQKASEKSFSLGNSTVSPKPITLTTGSGAPPKAGAQAWATIQEVKIDGLEKPKVSNIYVNKNDMKLHVSFIFKNVRVFGRCSAVSQAQQASTSGASSRKPLLEAAYWNASWSANVMPMIGREHFDLNRVYTTHSQKVHLNLDECPAALQDKARAALLERLRTTIESRLVEIMEIVMMQTDTTSDEADQAPASRTASRQLPAIGRRQSHTPSLSDALGLSGVLRPIMGAPASGRLAKRNAKGRALKRTKRQTPCTQGEELDEYVDQLFRFGTRIVRAMEPVTLPNTTIELPDYNLKIFLYEGKGTRAYKFRRAKPAWVFCSNETISLGVTIEVEELRVAYKYRVISGTRLLFDGDLEAKLSPRLQAQFSQAVQPEDSEEPVQQRVDRVRLFRLGRVHVVIRGLGNLTQSLSMIINAYLNDNQEELQPTFRMVEGDAVKMVNKLLANVNVPLLSVV